MIDRYAHLRIAEPRDIKRCCEIAVTRPMANGARFDCPIHGRGDNPLKNGKK